MQNDSAALLQRMRSGAAIPVRDQLRMVIRLSMPAIMAQLSGVVMHYIDTSMVGSLGAAASAAIGMVASTTWLVNNLCSAVSVGFTVLAAQAVGARDESHARSIRSQALLVAEAIALLFAIICAAISSGLPAWLGGSEDVLADASAYFLFYALFIPAHELSLIAGGLLQASGDMKTPGLLQVISCLLDVVFNAMLIPATRTVTLFGFNFLMPGAGLGVLGASLATGLAKLVVALCMLWFLLRRNNIMNLRRG